MKDKNGTPEEPLSIASVEPDLKRRYRYLIYAEGREEPILSVHEDILVRYRLFKGQPLTPELLAEITEADARQQAYSLAIGYLGAKPRTAREIERYLARKELPEEAAQAAIDRLRDERLIDDGEYARQFAEQRLRSHLKGSLLIRQELKQRGIGKAEAAGALQELDPDAELAAACKAAAKKWPYLKGEPREKRQKLALFLGRRGYPGSVVRQAVRETAEADGGLDELDSGDWLDN